MEKKLLFKPHDKQQEFIDAVFSGKYSFLCYGGAMGGGKSFVSIAILILLCKFYPNSKWVVIRDSVPTLKKTVIETFKRLVPKSFLLSYNSTDHIATFKNGSRIMFMAEDYANDKDFDRFKGLEVNGFLLEQIEELQQGLLDVCLIRAGRWKIDPMPNPIIIATVNPSQTWVKERIYEAWTKDELPKNWFYLPAKITDNSDLANDAKYMENLENLDDLTKARYLDGDWSAFAVNNPFAYAFDKSKHVSDEAIFKPFEPVMLSFDFNVDPITCIAFQGDLISKIDFIHEFELPNSDIYELCDRIVAMFPNSVFMVTGDATGRARSAISKGNINYYQIIKQKLRLSDTQLKTPTVNPSVADTRVLLNSLLQNGTIRIHSSLKNFIRDLKYVEVDDEGDIKKDRSSDTKKSDLLDCGRYAVHTFYRNFIKLNK